MLRPTLAFNRSIHERLLLEIGNEIAISLETQEPHKHLRSFPA